MNLSMDCKIYYSMIGERFNIFERHTDANIWSSKAIVQVQTSKLPLALAHYDGAEEEEEYEHRTNIAVMHEIKGGPYFASDTQCIIVNGKNQILKLGGKYRFDVKMYRNLDDALRFTVLFKEKDINDLPQWVSF